jgi:hypothetical protein
MQKAVGGVDDTEETEQPGEHEVEGRGAGFANKFPALKENPDLSGIQHTEDAGDDAKNGKTVGPCERRDGQNCAHG